MSSPSLGFSPWRARAHSVSSQDSQDDAQSRALSPPPHSTGDTRSLSIPSAPSAQRDPIRSFVHGSFRERLTPVDSAQHARTVREDTAELATYQLSDGSERRGRSFLSRQRSGSLKSKRDPSHEHDVPEPSETPSKPSETIPEVSEPSSPEERDDQNPLEGPSLIARMLKMSPPSEAEDEEDTQTIREHGSVTVDAGSSSGSVRRKSAQSRITEDHDDHPTETTALLRTTSHGSSRQNGQSGPYDIESQKRRGGHRFLERLGGSPRRIGDHVAQLARQVQDPKHWNRQALWESMVVAPVVCLPAVIVGLLLNILDALSYGMILFPLGNPIFANLGSAGISIFYVSTIISQLTFSCGSVFRGGIGSELIEVVPFFHSMAATITNIVGEDQPDAVIATTITSYALSSMMTGVVFFLMGKFEFGYLVGFIPRHILIGCIGGVGWFLVATGFEVSARIEGSFRYDLDTLHKLIQSDTIPLWATPLALAIILFYSKTKIDNKYFLSLYILAIPFVFYFFVLSLDQLDPNTLRHQGWIFDGPPADEPWWYFYTLYQFQKVHWGAIVECVPAMLALTFFGILHVPINVPALAFAAGEDYVDLNHELKLHGFSNFLSGAAGSIQNYLVYANTVFFMRAGGDSRLAGFELATFTFGVMLVGPKIIGFIPVMMVGCLIFVLGFELLFDAVWMPRKKLKLPEYLTVIAIVLIMGIYDFVVGIGVGIILAFVSMILQTSRISAVRASWSGEIIKSTVRRNPSQQHYLHQVGQQIYVTKLAGFLFFGTIVSVEENIRELIGDEAFQQRPIRYLILDLTQVTGLDYSAGEAFNRISRLLDNKGIELVLSGLDTDSALGRDLRAVGLGEDGADVQFLPDLNSALEGCENQLLITLYASQDELEGGDSSETKFLDVPAREGPSSESSSPQLASSPRRSHLQVAARESMKKVETPRLSKWQNFREPLRLMLQIFEDVSGKNEDFWFPAVPYFVKKEHPQGTVLFRVGESAEGFYLLEKGIIRAEYTLPHGQHYHESIVAGTTCGELPFFSETTRTATARVEKALVAWVLDQDAWRRLQKEAPEVAQELLRVSLKLTAERMATVPSSTMLMAQ